MNQAPYAIQRTRIEVALCIAAGALLVYKLGKVPTDSTTSARAALQHHRMVVCQRAARWFGEQAMRAELSYRKEVEL